MLVYVNNFPREGAVKGQEFKGNSDLKKELKERGIISDGDVTVKTKDTSGLEEKVASLEEANGGLEEKVASLEEANGGLEEKVASLEEAQSEIARLNGLVKDAISLPKGQVPDGFEG